MRHSRDDDLPTIGNAPDLAPPPDPAALTSGDSGADTADPEIHEATHGGFDSGGDERAADGPIRDDPPAPTPGAFDDADPSDHGPATDPAGFGSPAGLGRIGDSARSDDSDDQDRFGGAAHYGSFDSSVASSDFDDPVAPGDLGHSVVSGNFGRTVASDDRDDSDDSDDSDDPVGRGNFGHSVVPGNFGHNTVPDDSGYPTAPGDFHHSAAGNFSHSMAPDDSGYPVAADDVNQTVTSGDFANSLVAGDFGRSVASGYFGDSGGSGFGAHAGSGDFDEYDDDSGGSERNGGARPDAGPDDWPGSGNGGDRPHAGAHASGPPAGSAETRQNGGNGSNGSNGDGRPIAVITGASAGIGAATARRLAAAGFRTILGARRIEQLLRLAAEISGTALPLDVTDQASVTAFCSSIPHCRILVNNAGGARGLEPVAMADEEHWRWMWETNVLGTLRVTKALLPALIESGDGHIVTVTSIGAFETYDGGAGYTSAKHAQGALHRTLRSELLGQPVRLTEVCPGMVRTDFSLLRFDGDADRADAVYRGIEPLVAEDVADVIEFVVTRPSNVNIDQIVMKPRAQASATNAHRTEY